MERLRCPTCANEVFFDSLACVRCHTELSLALGADGAVSLGDAATVGACLMRDTWRCNWRPATPGRACASCSIVDAGEQGRNHLMVPFLSAQRRALKQLAELGVPWQSAANAAPSGPPLRFTYRSRSAGDDALIGHIGGLITLDLDEADPAHREQVRATLGEQYRTPLGHIRHELGHFVWLRDIAPDPARLASFREIFGDERVDYQHALDAHYGRLDDGSWRDRHVSYYAAAHPWEDFAESWAQIMHVHDVVSTGAAWGVIEPPGESFDPRTWVSSAVTASLAANELARAMGMRDLYPFALSSGARRRIERCWELVHPRALAPVPDG